jgi:hypothetical protein
VVFGELGEDDGTHRCAFGGGVLLPIETEALTTDVTVNVLPEL